MHAEFDVRALRDRAGSSHVELGAVRALRRRPPGSVWPGWGALF